MDFCYKDGQKKEMDILKLHLLVATITRDEDKLNLWDRFRDRLTNELKTIGLSFDWIFIWNKGYAEARQECVEVAKIQKATHILFIDSDTFIPPDATKDILLTAVNYGLQVIALPVYLKRFPLISNIHQDIMFEKLAKLPRNLFQIDLTGLAACLIDMKVFDKIQEPYFRGDLTILNNKGINFHLKTGEDTAFFLKIKQAGIKAYCEPKWICSHYDKRNDIMYPQLEKGLEGCYDDEERNP
jgi:hypothetical protein